MIRTMGVFKTAKTLSLCLALLLTAAFTLQLGAAPAKKDLDKQERAKIVQQVGKALIDNYVFPDKGKEMAEHIQKLQKKGTYKKINDHRDFAEQLTKDVRDISHDLHIRIRFQPEPPRRRQGERPSREEVQARYDYTNGGFKEVKRLPGNVGYLRFDGFNPAEFAGATAVAAINFLNNVDALIIDLRYNGGGAPSMIQLICSYFFEEPTHLNSFYIRKGEKTHQFWTQAHVKGKLMTETEIFVLTSKRTFSAAEEFTYNLKNLERATIVGETTGGGAHPVNFHYLDEIKFGMSIPFGRAVNPVTKTNWEGTGIKPHVEVPQAEAYDKAYALALEKLAKKAEKPEKVKALESDINGEGYRALMFGNTKKAIKLFELNVKLFPKSSNAYDSLGEAYMKSKQKDLATKNYKKSLELNPKNDNAAKMLKKLETKN